MTINEVDLFIEINTKLRDRLIKTITDFWVENKNLSVIDFYEVNALSIATLIVWLANFIFKEDAPVDLRVKYIDLISYYARDQVKFFEAVDKMQ